METINQSDYSAQIRYRAFRGTEGCGGKQRVHRKGWRAQRGAEVGTKLECHGVCHGIPEGYNLCAEGGQSIGACRSIEGKGLGRWGTERVWKGCRKGEEGYNTACRYRVIASTYPVLTIDCKQASSFTP